MPRWRTMIEPAETSWPSPALTPRRWPTLSRPFFELEPAFLCAMSLLVLLRARRRRARRWSCGGRRLGALAWSRSSAAAFAAASAVVPWPCVLRRGLGRLRRLASRRLASRLPPCAALRCLGGGLPSAARGLRLAASLAASAWSAAAFFSASPGGLRALGLLSFSGAPASSAALRPLKRMSATRRTVCSWRWPFLERWRALGRYLKTISFSPRSWRSDVAQSRGRRRRSACRSGRHRRRQRAGRDRS